MRAIRVPPIILQVVQAILLIPSVLDVFLLFQGAKFIVLNDQPVSAYYLHACLGFFLSISAYLVITEGWSTATYFLSWYEKINLNSRRRRRY
jgi:hypothetical protein